MRIIHPHSSSVTAVLLLSLTLLYQDVQSFAPSPRVRSSPTALSTASKESRTQDDTNTHSTTAKSPASQIRLNPLVESVKPSKTVEVFGLVKQLQSQGIDVTSLCVGEPDFLPPPAVLEATRQAVQEGDTRYTAVTGTLELRNAIAADLKRRKNVNYNPNTEIVVGNGAKQCVYQSVLATVGMGDGVLIPAPYWPSYPEMVALAGADSVIVETAAETGYCLTAPQLRAALQANPNIRLMILCNPSNPTGGVYNRAELQELANVLKEYPHVAVVADEIYERLVYPPASTTSSIPKEDWCPSFASIDGMFDRTMTINGFSKAYAMTGYRLGYVAAPARLAAAISTLQSQITSCAGSISQAAGVAALTQVDDQVLDDNVAIMQSKRDFVLQELSNMPHVQLPPTPPSGAFYVLANVAQAPGYDGDDAQLCLDLLQSHQLALVPGSSFGAPGSVRLSYATSMEELQTAMTKLSNFLSNL